MTASLWRRARRRYRKSAQFRFWCGAIMFVLGVAFVYKVLAPLICR
ncbi:hypothetical protein DESUT3_37730 [Desulfuromonas versatilis]|uniref:Uncharacterized protein n=1 Tax=Desulfuromonas versatilis TaxID=2802975 RepID=A0ABM8I1B2_9BACT|nr:hypothetical protein [Desulfuromonas versatilis]BCR06704.1 hypothetical protein DESUT3_37730 [Desulfuromonas versatilis]